MKIDPVDAPSPSTGTDIPPSGSLYHLRHKSASIYAELAKSLHFPVVVYAKSFGAYFSSTLAEYETNPNLMQTQVLT